MAQDTLILLAAIALVALLLVLILLRKGSEEALGRLQERVAAQQGELRAALQAGTRETGDKIAQFTIDQMRVTNEVHGKTSDALAEQRAALLGQGAALQRDMAQALADLRADAARAETARATREAEGRAALGEQAAALRRDLAQAIGDLRILAAEAEARQQKALAEQMNASRDLIERKLGEMREANDGRLAEIQKSVNEQLASAVEKQMAESFTRVIDQFNAIQAMMGNVSAVASQVGDLKRLFGNVKTRGGWGETQVKALLDDILPAGAYETNVRLREDSADSVEFAVVMPTTGAARVFLAVDAKFPVEDYERLLSAWDANDAVAEAQARRGLEARVRGEAQKIAAKYICPPRTVEFGVMYVPTEGLYAEIARIPGLIDDIGRSHRVLLLGPTLLPAMLRTIQLGHVTLALSKNAEGVRDLLAATKTEMSKMDGVLERLGKQVGTVGRTIGEARTRTRAVARKLSGLEAMPGEAAEALLEIEANAAEDAEP